MLALPPPRSYPACIVDLFWRTPMKARWSIAVVGALLALTVGANAQGIVGGAQEGASKGAREGNRAAGPVGGAVGTVVGGTAGAVSGGVKGALGVSDKPKKKKSTNN